MKQQNAYYLHQGNKWPGTRDGSGHHKQNLGKRKPDMWSISVCNVPTCSLLIEPCNDKDLHGSFMGNIFWDKIEYWYCYKGGAEKTSLKKMPIMPNATSSFHDLMEAQYENLIA